MKDCRGLLVLGFGGHARSVADVALACGIPGLLFVDSHARPGEQFREFPVVKDLPDELPEGWLCFPAAGDNRRRQAQVELVRGRGWPLATLVAPTATVGVGANVSPGSFVAHHAHIGPMAGVGEGALINTGAIVEHECTIGDYVHISVHATVAGRSRIGDFCFICAGATVIDGVEVGPDVVVGAGGVVVKDLCAPGVYVGVPCRPVSREV